MKILLCAILVLVAFASNSQTYVTIPDANFVSWLQTNYPSCMNGNQMDITCTNITNETSVDVSSQSISDLTGIQYFTALSNLNCSDNLLTTLPGLPANLTILSCDGNALTALPTLPAGLEQLICYNNNLTSLPGLPGSLTTLYCLQNNLASLPALPFFMSTLDCSHNSLTGLPALPGSLTTLHCENNSLTSLPALPGGLTVFSCNNNNLTSLPALPSFLDNLECQNNTITSLPNLPSSVRHLNAANNNISCFPIFSNNLLTISIIPNPFTCLPNYVNAMDVQTKAYPLCINGDMVNNPNGCLGASGGITGFAFKDNNTDCIRNTGDSAVKNIPFLLYDNNNNLIGQTYSYQNGSYQFVTAPGTYTVHRPTSSSYTYLCASPGASSTVTVTQGNPLVTDVNFDIACRNGFDIGVKSAVPVGRVFPGQQHTLQVVAGDMAQWFNLHCANAPGGQVKITVTGPVTYNGPAPGALTPTVGGNIYTYTISDFDNVNILHDFGLLFTTNNTAHAGDAICVTISVTPTAGDKKKTNNHYNFCYHVVNSYDPNLKEVYPENVLPGFSDWLTYTIHFQNTGSAPAFNIRVADTLSNNLDLDSFEVISYSHFNRTSLTGNAVDFSFPDIMLPDSSSDLAGSHGFISYRIKPKPSLPAGTEMSNHASIYFDYNAPIVTDTALTRFENPCPGQSVVMSSNITGDSYQWEVDMGNGFVSLADDNDYLGSTSRTLQLNNPPSSWYGYQYRCLTDSGTSSITVLKFVQTWMGFADNHWENPLNWSCGTVPDANTDVIIISKGAMSPQPTVSSNRSCRSLTVSPGAMCTVAPGFTLNVLH